TGKEYDRNDLVIDQVYDLPGTKPAAAASKGGKANPPSKSSKKTAPAVVEVDVEQLAKDTLVAILADAGGSLAKSKISMKVLTKLMSDPNRENVRNLVFTDEFLALEDGWSYNKAKATVTIAG
ncbi:MAG: hypothetical protein V4498_03215, partial [candidate division FCPU426 bacterium]